jgi:hypothetical protein
LRWGSSNLTIKDGGKKIGEIEKNMGNLNNKLSKLSKHLQTSSKPKFSEKVQQTAGFVVFFIILGLFIMLPVGLGILNIHKA